MVERVVESKAGHPPLAALGAPTFVLVMRRSGEGIPFASFHRRAM
jgi:hypothetical protein